MPGIELQQIALALVTGAVITAPAAFALGSACARKQANRYQNRQELNKLINKFRKVK